MRTKELHKQAKELEFLGLIEIEEEPVYVGEEELTRLIYQLTEFGERIAEDIFQELPEETKKKLRVLEELNHVRLDRVLDYLHEHYPEMLEEK